MKLKTAIEYIDSIDPSKQEYTDLMDYLSTFEYNVKQYNIFLKQPLQLWMFIPCDKLEKPDNRGNKVPHAVFINRLNKWEENNGKPLEKPYDYQNYLLSNEKFGMLRIVYDNDWFKLCREYQQACERCLFTGFELYQDTYFNNYNCVIRGSDMVIINIENKTIEDIAPLKVEVTDRVAKQFKY